MGTTEIIVLLAAVFAVFVVNALALMQIKQALKRQRRQTVLFWRKLNEMGKRFTKFDDEFTAFSKEVSGNLGAAINTVEARLSVMDGALNELKDHFNSQPLPESEEERERRMQASVLPTGNVFARMEQRVIRERMKGGTAVVNGQEVIGSGS